MTWKIVDHDDTQVTVELDDGQRLNVNVSRDVNVVAQPRVAPTVPAAGTAEPPPRVLSVTYHFAAGAVLPEHLHDANTLHNIEVVSGSVLVKKTSGDVAAVAGDIVTLAVGELHTVVGVTEAETLHRFITP